MYIKSVTEGIFWLEFSICFKHIFTKEFIFNQNYEFRNIWMNINLRPWRTKFSKNIEQNEARRENKILFSR